MVDNNRPNNVNSDIEDKYCNLRSLSESLSACLLDGDDIHLGHYINAYKELQKFCTLLGSMFGFVASELESKTGILIEFRKEDECGNFLTMNSMIKYEVDNKLLKNSNYYSGCRTLLLLNRGLDFLRKFLEKTAALSPDDGTSSIGRQCYDETLANHHVWYVRLGAQVAMLTMPTKQNLLNYVLGDSQSYMLDFLPSVITAANKVHDRTFNTLKNHNLLDLA